MKILEKGFQIYAFIFARSIFSKWNNFLYHLALRGLGIGNFQPSKMSGEHAFLRDYLSLNPGILIDIGANCGEYAKEALSIQSNLTIFCLEPHPKTFKTLEENIGSFKNITLINKGVSATRGSVNLYDYHENDGSPHASLYKEVITSIHHTSNFIKYEVDVITLDELIEVEGIEEVSLLKVDTEGNELAILKSGSKALSSGKIKAIHFEFNEMNVISRTFFRDFFEILSGYKIYRLLPNDLLEIKSYRPLSCEIYGYQNIVAIKC
jgi:FkbM family methyltransferase